MRPDEHKKKNSARYKKKHGTDSIANNKNSSKDVEPIDSFDQGVLNEVDDCQEKHFSRRKVTSNWNRYDEPEETVQHIGADFHQLIGAAGGADSHMIFESEKHWDDKHDLDEILTIDFQKLADSLVRLPFCERLGLDESQFDSSLLKLLHDDAPEDSISSSVSAFTLKEFDFQKPPVKIDKEISNGAKLEKSDEVQESESLKPSTYDQEAFSEMKTPQAIVSTVSLTEKTDVSKDVAQNSQDVFVQSTSSTALQPSAAPAEMKSLELELDSLLTGTTSSSFAPAKAIDIGKNDIAPAPKPKNVESNKEQDDLEDWLDSII